MGVLFGFAHKKLHSFSLIVKLINLDVKADFQEISPVVNFRVLVLAVDWWQLVMLDPTDLLSGLFVEGLHRTLVDLAHCLCKNRHNNLTRSLSRHKNGF